MATPMTLQDLVRAVTDLSQRAPLVTGEMIEQWCSENGVDPGIAETPHNKFFWDADLGERRGRMRLQKFKRSIRDHTAPNAWCLRSKLADARLQARIEGWYELPWDARSSSWNWQKGAIP